MKRVIDLTVPLQDGMQVFVGDPVFSLKRIREAGKGSDVTLSIYEGGTHSGTHVDFPLHFIPGGKRQGDYPVSRFFVKGKVVDVGVTSGEISKRDLSVVTPADRGKALVIRTGFSSQRGSDRYLYDWPYIGREASQFLAEIGPSFVTTEGMSIAGWSGSEFPRRVDWEEVVYVHRLLLGRDILIVETLNDSREVLDQCGGEADFLFLPLNLKEAEASPVRVVAVC